VSQDDGRPSQQFADVRRLTGSPATSRAAQYPVYLDRVRCSQSSSYAVTRSPQTALVFEVEIETIWWLKSAYERQLRIPNAKVVCPVDQRSVIPGEVLPNG
jgi:hypothetical protein